MSHLLDRPIWSALKSRHAALGQGDDLAARYAPDIHPFACARDDEPESLAALAALIGPGETQIFLQAGDFVAPAGVDVLDIPEFVAVLLGSNTDCVALLKADTNADGNVNGNDIPGFTDALVP